MKEPISIKEILAIILKRGKVIICITLAMAILCGGFMFTKRLQEATDPDNSDSSIDIRNEALWNAYLDEKEELENMVTYMQNKLYNQKDYNENSILMSLDPYHLYQSYIAIAVTGIESKTDVDAVRSEIQQKYLAYWTALSLEDMLDDLVYQGVEERYLREIVSLQVGDGGTITVTVLGATEKAAEAVRVAVYEWLNETQKTIASTTANHRLTVIASSTNSKIDYDMDHTQKDNLEYVEQFEQELEKYQDKLDDLRVPTLEAYYTTGQLFRVAIKGAILGAVVGFLLACIGVWLWYVLRDGIETTRRAEAVLNVPFFGAAGGCGDVFARMATRFMGDPLWKDAEQAELYIRESVRSRIGAPQRIALLSTMSMSEDNAAVELVTKVMTELGHDVIFADRAEENPKTLSALRECDCVMLIERMERSNCNAMVKTIALAKELGAETVGFFTA